MSEDRGWFTVVFISLDNPADVGDVFPEFKKDPSLVLSRNYSYYPHEWTEEKYYDDDLEKWIPERHHYCTREVVLETVIDQAQSWYYHSLYGPNKNAAVIDHTGKIHAIVEFIRRVRRHAGE